MEIKKLYFGIKIFNPNTRKSETTNLFNSSRVLWSIAKYIEFQNENPKNFECNDPLYFCFGDLKSRAEYEFLISSWPQTDNAEVIKTDVYTMYVEPNQQLLMNIINQVSIDSAKEYLKDSSKSFKV